MWHSSGVGEKRKGREGSSTVEEPHWDFPSVEPSNKRVRSSQAASISQTQPPRVPPPCEAPSPSQAHAPHAHAHAPPPVHACVDQAHAAHYLQINKVLNELYNERRARIVTHAAQPDDEEARGALHQAYQ